MNDVRTGNRIWSRVRVGYGGRGMLRRSITFRQEGGGSDRGAIRVSLIIVSDREPTVCRDGGKWAMFLSDLLFAYFEHEAYSLGNQR